MELPTNTTLSSNRDASCISTEGEQIIEVVTLDDFVKNETISFIKLDIEGAELEALKGAKNIIKRDRPQMAICIYHKPEDIIDIPIYLKSILPNYRFYIRHKNIYFFDTILYCI